MGENIEQALAAIYGAVGYVQKERKQGLSYTFASESALIEALRPAMVEQGVTVRVVALSDVKHEAITVGKSESVMQRTTLIATVRFAHAASATHIDVVAAGEGMDSGDKSSNKAMTCALKYALRQTFLIETGDDPDRDAYDSEPRPARLAPKPTPMVNRETGEITASAPEWKAQLGKLLKDAGLKMGDLAAVIGAPVTQANYVKAIDYWLGVQETDVFDLVGRALEAKAAALDGAAARQMKQGVA